MNQFRLWATDAEIIAMTSLIDTFIIIHSQHDESMEWVTYEAVTLSRLGCANFQRALNHRVLFTVMAKPCEVMQ